MKKTILFTVIFFSISIFFIIYLINLNNFKCIKPINEIKKNPTMNIIVARYNEKLKWTNTAPFNKYKYMVYNKGSNEDFEKKNVYKTINLPNLGREAHTYLYHIINNYDNLADINVFLPGSVDTNHKMFKKEMYATKIIDYIEKYKNAVFLSFGKPKNNNILEEFYDFKMDEYVSTTVENKNINNETILRKSKYRPYHKWFNNNFGDISVPYFIYHGIFSVNKQDILSKPKKYYENLLKLVDDHSNPEDGHFFERSWAAIFYPLNNTHVITDNDMVKALENYK